MADTYEVLVDEVTIHRQVGELTDPITGRSLGIQQGAGKIWFKGEVIPENEISPLYREALEDEDHPMHAAVSKRLKKSGDEARENTSQRLGVPFAGFDDMSEDELLDALRSLPSATIQVVKQYEAQNQNRERIVSFNLGFGESIRDREEGRVGSDLDEDGRDDSDKAVAELTTREVGEDTVQHGEGITGTGEGQIPYGSTEQGDDDGSEARATQRRGRRARTQGRAKAKPKAEDTSGDGSDES